MGLTFTPTPYLHNQSLGCENLPLMSATKRQTCFFGTVVLISLFFSANGFVFANETESKTVLIQASTDSIRKVAVSPRKALLQLSDQGKEFYRNGEYENAFGFFAEALKLAVELNDYEQTLGLLTYLGQISYLLSAHKESLDYFHHALDVGGNNIPQSKKAQIYSGLADTYLALGDYNQALDYQLKSLEIRETLKDEKEIAKSYYGLGSVFFEQKLYSQALDYYKKALEVWKKIDNPQWVLTTLSAIGTTYGSMGKWDQALYFDLEALKLVEKDQNKDVSAMAYILHSAGVNYTDLGDFKNAEDYLFRSYKLAPQTGNQQFESNTLESIGYMYMKSGKYEISIDYFNRALQIATKIGAKSDIAKIKNSLAEAYHKTGNQEAAYQYLKQHATLKDSLLTSEMIDRMNNLQNSYEIQKKEKEVALLTSKNKLKKLYLYFASLGGLALIVLLWLAYGRYKAETKAKYLVEMKNAEIEVQNKKLAVSNSDLEQFAYVASHDLKEPLRMINNYSNLLNKRYQNKIDESGKEFLYYISDAATRMDKLLDGLLEYSRVNRKNLDSKNINLAEVVKTVTNTLQERIKQTKAKVYIGKLPSIQANYTQMIQVFQNLMGNALKFNNSDGAEIIIDSYLEEDDYVFMVKDNGIGIDEENIDRIFQVFQRLHTHREYEGTGIGLSITKKIVERYGGKIWVTSEPGKGSTFYFTLPKATQLTEKTIVEPASQTPALALELINNNITAI